MELRSAAVQIAPCALSPLAGRCWFGVSVPQLPGPLDRPGQKPAPRFVPTKARRAWRAFNQSGVFL